jgi:hypothetical protein
MCSQTQTVVRLIRPSSDSTALLSRQQETRPAHLPSSHSSPSSHSRASHHRFQRFQTSTHAVASAMTPLARSTLAYDYHGRYPFGSNRTASPRLIRRRSPSCRTLLCQVSVAVAPRAWEDAGRATHKQPLKLETLKHLLDETRLHAAERSSQIREPACA